MSFWVTQALPSAIWTLIIGVLMITMALSGSLLKRLPLSSAMLYLVVGFALGPAGWALITPDPSVHYAILETIAEIALLVSLFAVGLKLGVPLRDRRWHLPLRLAFTSMALTVLFITAIGIYALGLSAGAAVLLAAILAPTDPVLASDVQVADSSDRDRLRFSLTAEGGLNDGVAFPFVMLGLGMLGLYDLGAGGWRWLVIDVLWGTLGGLLIGSVLGALIGKLVVYLRTHHQEAMGLDEFLALGLIAIAYGCAQLGHASGFLAVFAAGLGLQRIKTMPRANQATIKDEADSQSVKVTEEGIRTDQANAHMMVEAVQGFNEQLERLAELAVVMVVGAMLFYTNPPRGAAWFLPLLFLVVRPVAIWLGLRGATVSRDQRVMISWFGIRGIGSIYYLAYVINHGLPEAMVGQMVALTLTTVAVSIMLHGISVTPMMRLYAQRIVLRRRK